MDDILEEDNHNWNRFWSHDSSPNDPRMHGGLVRLTIQLYKQESVYTYKECFFIYCSTPNLIFSDCTGERFFCASKISLIAYSIKFITNGEV